MDMQQIDALAELMERRGLTRVRLEDKDGSAVELECHAAPAPAQAATAPVAATPEAAPAAAPEAPSAPAPAPAADPSLTSVVAPMVGVFYAAPSPGAEPFVKVGSKVRKGDTLCVIEAMKLMNEVTAERDGEVVEVCAEDGDLVDYGRCLMKIR